MASAAKPGSSVGSAQSRISGSANTAPSVHAGSAIPQQAGASNKGGFGIQLGAFSSEASASAQWRTLSAKYASQLQGLQQHVVPADTASGRIYRLQAAVGNEDRARAICVQLRTYGQACVAVLPH
jgi:cell division septation protein DedD